MDLAVLHYHLGHGGVTRVIANHLQALAATSSTRRLRVHLLHGGRCDGWPADFPLDGFDSITLHQVEGLDYESESTPTPAELTGRIHHLLVANGCSADSTILHVHNHSLGKNTASPFAPRLLADRGYRLLLQIHDFAEDLRPDNYLRLRQARAATEADFGRTMYPVASHVHFAVLNSRDRNILLGAGIENVHFLPNPVFPTEQLVAKPIAKAKLAEKFGVPVEKPFFLYPVRAIRRKNLGEVLLWSALGKDNAFFAVSLPTLNPAEQTQYRKWKQMASDLQLPFIFELGAQGGLEFRESLGAADRILTTSLAEGFGMVFLEAWLAGRPLVGRDLPEITGDFKEAGLDLQALHPVLQVPAELVDRRHLLDQLSREYRRVCQDYDMQDLNPDVEAVFEAKASGNFIDFGDLDEHLQASILQQCVESDDARTKVLHANPWLGDCFTRPTGSENALVQENADAVLASFGAQSVGARLWMIYDTLLSAEPGDMDGQVDTDSMLRQFLDPRRFRLLRT